VINTPVNTLEGPLTVLREAEMRLLTDIAGALVELNAEEDRKKLLEMAEDLRDLFFLVVVIGEFNAGKSSFINALLGEDLLPTGITPTTEVIELIQYDDAPQRKPVAQEEGLRRWKHPNTGAQGVAIVDTPGTGSVFQKHERIAKEFLHRSDLVIFVISAKRAFAETERLYLELAKSYGKKVVLVVNQIDLLQPNEQSEVRRFIETQVKELLELQPLIFMVSSKEALTQRDQRGAGGIDAVRAHLRGVFSEAPPAKQKLLAQLDTAARIVKRHRDALKGKTDLVGADTAKVRDVQAEMERQSLGLDTQLKEARADIDTVFEGMRQRGLNFIDTNLSIRKIGRSPNKEKLQNEFQEIVVGRALRDINDATSGYINAVIDQSRLYWRSVIDRLNQLRDLLENELTGLDAGVYAEQRESLQEAIRIAEAELKSYSSGRVVNAIEETFKSNMSGFTTSVLAAVSGWIMTVLAIATHGPLIGAGAAPLAFPAFIVGLPLAALGSYATIRYYRRVTQSTKSEFNARIDQLEKSYYEALDELTVKERNRL
jgi:small GTP-binding protein